MKLNTLFLGKNSVVAITTNETLSEIKLKLATRYDHCRHYPVLSEEQKDFTSPYVYNIKSSNLKVYFNKDLNPKGLLQAPYPQFIGQIIDNGNSRSIMGKIGFPELTYYWVVLWFVLFFRLCVDWIDKGDQMRGGETAPYFILFVLLSLLIVGIRIRRRVDEMKKELETAFQTEWQQQSPSPEI
ncbi:MAG: hypothetical protein JST14_01315 [Bacteroidetes bacterium]|nr:hypothetical protein [Bacteroidota bacterium]